MDTEESRKFWESFPKRKDADDRRVLPSLGDCWWEAEKELSPSLLGKTWKELTEEEDLGALVAARKIGEDVKYIPKKPNIFTVKKEEIKMTKQEINKQNKMMVCVNCDKKFNVNDEGGMFISYTNMMFGYAPQDLCGDCADSVTDKEFMARVHKK